MAKMGTCKRACLLIQLYVKLLETDENGYGYCCSCGQSFSWGDLHGGHFQPKGRHYNAASFEEDNVHIQCCTCNTYRGGNPAGYSQYMNDNYGQDVIEYLKQESYKTLDTESVRDIARTYKDKCKMLAKDKNFTVKIPT